MRGVEKGKMAQICMFNSNGRLPVNAALWCPEAFLCVWAWRRRIPNIVRIVKTKPHITDIYLFSRGRYRAIMMQLQLKKMAHQAWCACQNWWVFTHGKALKNAIKVQRIIIIIIKAASSHERALACVHIGVCTGFRPMRTAQPSIKCRAGCEHSRQALYRQA